MCSRAFRPLRPQRRAATSASFFGGCRPSNGLNQSPEFHLWHASEHPRSADVYRAFGRPTCGLRIAPTRWTSPCAHGAPDNLTQGVLAVNVQQGEQFIDATASPSSTDPSGGRFGARTPRPLPGPQSLARRWHCTARSRDPCRSFGRSSTDGRTRPWVASRPNATNSRARAIVSTRLVSTNVAATKRESVKREAKKCACRLRPSTNDPIDMSEIMLREVPRHRKERGREKWRPLLPRAGHLMHQQPARACGVTHYGAAGRDIKKGHTAFE
jgi:hypothetical protein